MSETDTPIISRPHVLARDAQGVTAWRPVLTTLSVHGVVTDHNARHIVVREDGIERYRFRLDAELAAHIASLLVSGDPAAAEQLRGAA
ncbi:hypothetical protein G3T14_21365 [Methylobacterium sp. BTF04]|uniref:hypothetical protein n=1 Tax=Methylobacterium sp. BTF04 TaxID=2708300 RepID=UPI0013D6DB4E|nr:hypothetical protein [Methylobacterium sp. BTF04]NEU14636.1 hypothetical protein [Methylobacterium sp. BTF04]